VECIDAYRWKNSPPPAIPPKNKKNGNRENPPPPLKNVWFGEKTPLLRRILSEVKEVMEKVNVTVPWNV